MAIAGSMGKSRLYKLTLASATRTYSSATKASLCLKYATGSLDLFLASYVSGSLEGFTPSQGISRLLYFNKTDNDPVFFTIIDL